MEYMMMYQNFCGGANLPRQFALKWNFGCGYNVICDDIDKLDINKTEKIMSEWGKKEYHLPYAEMQYANRKKKIIAEKYLNTKDGFLPTDYKCYCFDGKVLAILVMKERDTNLKCGFYSSKWEYLGSDDKQSWRPYADAKMPKSLEHMIDCAENLSQGIPFVRIDFYEVDGKSIFGEMTFSPAGGYFLGMVNIDGKPMEEYIDINKKYPLLEN
jgi:hypothetical protein